MALKMVDTHNILKALGMSSHEKWLKEKKTQIAFSMKGAILYNSKTSHEFSLSKKLVKNLMNGLTCEDEELKTMQLSLLKALNTVLGSDTMGVAHQTIPGVFGPLGKPPSKQFKSTVTDSLDVIESTFGEKSKFGTGTDAMVIGVDMANAENEAVSSMFNPNLISTPKSKFKKTPAMIMSGSKIDLINATLIYQPVKSTSKDSKYFVVAIHEDLKIAARVKKGHVSVRAQGNLKKHQGALIEAGFTMHGQPFTHASFHVDATGVISRKVIGSALLGLGLEFKSMIMKIDPIMDKGA